MDFGTTRGAVQTRAVADDSIRRGRLERGLPLAGLAVRQGLGRVAGRVTRDERKRAERFTREAERYVAVLGAVEQTRYTGDDGRLGHADLTIGGAPFMLSDEYPEFGPGIVSPTTLGGTPFSMHVAVPDVDAVYAQVVADGRAQVGREPHDEAYGARSFDMIDPFGHRWMIQTPIATPTNCSPPSP